MDETTEAMAQPPRQIDPDTLVKPLLDVDYPLPAGTGLYDSTGRLIAVLGDAVKSDDPEFDYSVPLLAPEDEGDA